MAEEQVPEPADETKDPDVKPVNIFEDYRKAKRNTLLWSSLTIMASFGTIWPIWTGSERVNDDITFSWLAGGIAFPPIAVIAVFALTAIYMRLNFNWADRRMMLSNSPLLFEQSGNELARVLSSVTEEAEAARTAIEKVYHEFERGPAREAEVRTIISRERNDLFNSITKMESKASALDAEAQDNNINDVWMTGMRDLRNGLTDLAAAAGKYMQKTAERLTEEDDEALSEGKVKLDADADRLTMEILRLRRTIDNITGLHDSIATSERLRAFLLDYVPTFAAFWGSILVAAVAIYFQIYEVPTKA